MQSALQTVLRRSPVPALAALALALSACGGGGEGTTVDSPQTAGTTTPSETEDGGGGGEASRKDVAREVEELCADLRDQVGSIPTPGSAREQEEYDATVEEAEDTLISALRGFEVPAEDRAAFDDYVNAQEEAFARLRELRASGESGESNAPEAQAAEEAAARAEELASDLGFSSCSQV